MLTELELKSFVGGSGSGSYLFDCNSQECEDCTAIELGNAAVACEDECGFDLGSCHDECMDSAYDNFIYGYCHSGV